MGWGAKDYLIEVARGGVDGAVPFGSFGERIAGSSEVNRVIWPNGVFTLLPEVGAQLTLSSTSVDDDIDAGTGIRSIHMHYLDADLNEMSEEIDLQGTGAVTTDATDIRFIQCMHIAQAGAGAKAAGIINAKVGAVIYSQIAVGDVRCSSSARMVPKDKRCFIVGLVGGTASGTAAARVTMRLVSNEFGIHKYVDPFILIPYASVGLQDSSETFNLPVPLPFSAGTVIALTATTDKAATISGSWFGWLEDVES